MVQPALVAYSVCSFFGMLAFLIPSPWHWRVKNRATLIMIGWGALGNFTGAVTGAIFSNTIENVAPRWCDFAASVDYVWPFGFGAGSLLLLRRLHMIASTRQVSQTEAERRKNLILECLLGIVFPLLLVPLHFVNQGHRMDIIEGYGCAAPLYPTLVAVFTFQIWQVLLNFVSLIYGVLTVRWFFIRRRQFAAVLQSSHAGMSQSKYLRLMAMASLELLYGFPFSLYIFIDNIVNTERQPYVSWSFVHQGFNTTYSVPRDELAPALLKKLDVSRWFSVIAAAIFFAFFGLGPEAFKEYRAAFKSMRGRVPCLNSSRMEVAAEAPAGDTCLSSRGQIQSSLNPTRWDEVAEKGWSPSSQKNAFETVQLQGLSAHRSEFPAAEETPYVHVITERLVTH